MNMSSRELSIWVHNWGESLLTYKIDIRESLSLGSTKINKSWGTGGLQYDVTWEAGEKTYGIPKAK